MKKLFLKTLVIISLFLGIIYIIGDSIGRTNSPLENLKKYASHEFKLKLMNTLFIYKKSQILTSRLNELEKNMLVKTNGQNSFELKENNEIYIYTNTKNIDDYEVNVYGYDGTNKTICLSKKFNHNFRFKIRALSEECENSLYFMGHISSLNKNTGGNKNLYFYFSKFKKHIKKNKSLLVLPISNFYQYSSNNNGSLLYSNSVINDDSTYGMPYITRINSVPQYNHIRWSEKTLRSIKNIKKAKINFDIVYDYHLENLNIDEYDLIILPMHNEYASSNFVNKMINFLKIDENKKILSIGGTNFMREVEYKYHNKELDYIIYKDGLNKIWNMVEDHKYFSPRYWSTNGNDSRVVYIFKNCRYKNLKNDDLGEMFFPIKSEKSKHYFYDIKCKNNLIPIISVTKVEKGSLIEINSDKIGMEFNNYPKIKNFIINLIK